MCLLRPTPTCGARSGIPYHPPGAGVVSRAWRADRRMPRLRAPAEGPRGTAEPARVSPSFTADDYRLAGQEV
ncbi:MAG: hypothetical protein JOZ63_08915 [Planctomycetaceae bacterium]|nr:hypothetical protein [Planctomycetaceae bacterium]